MTGSCRPNDRRPTSAQAFGQQPWPLWTPGVGSPGFRDRWIGALGYPGLPGSSKVNPVVVTSSQ